jgi:hypothetical protein
MRLSSPTTEPPAHKKIIELSKSATHLVLAVAVAAGGTASHCECWKLAKMHFLRTGLLDVVGCRGIEGEKEGKTGGSRDCLISKQQSGEALSPSERANQSGSQQIHFGVLIAGSGYFVLHSRVRVTL